ncbi:hypothetical protein BXZ70DRAFT_1080355 [Cristinia sonorae]|uniref:Uncharacterized protein n=1 Tax=Cristinia sonorae TaxID=1940300 RepID=A0A8K0UGP6_9AGAR|nr:hypothetical protein BXZ70DRAFT_1080355 [Cristinia sonorae]
MPRGEKGGTSAKPVQIQCASRATAHHTSKVTVYIKNQKLNKKEQKTLTDSPQLPQTAQELEGNRQKSQHSPGIPRPAKKAQRPEKSSNSLRRGYHTVERGEEVSINWMMRKGKVLSRAVKRKYKEKKQDRNRVK